MKTIKLTHNTGACHIHIGDKIIQHITNTEWAKNGNQFTIIIDKNVRSLYAKKIENDIRFILTANRMSSIDIKITITFFLFKKIPMTPRKKIIAPRDK